MEQPLKLLIPDNWKNYELIDTGDFEKLERFGKYIIRRPETQALWNKRLDEKKWMELADATFIRDNSKISNRDQNTENGGWRFKKKLPETWNIDYHHNGLQIQFILHWTTFGHTGIFPEQADNWGFIYQKLISFKLQKPKVLNLFAYTGGASMAAALAGAEVTHVDSVKSTITWANENRGINKLEGIRWVIEDAFKFAARELKRGKKYNGIILDPPPYGRGPNGEIWKLEDKLNDLIKICSQLLEQNNSFLILNLYSLRFSPLVAKNIIQDYFPYQKSEFGENGICSGTGQILPLGSFVRF